MTWYLKSACRFDFLCSQESWRMHNDCWEIIAEQNINHLLIAKSFQKSNYKSLFKIFYSKKLLTEVCGYVVICVFWGGISKSQSIQKQWEFWKDFNCRQGHHVLQLQWHHPHHGLYKWHQRAAWLYKVTPVTELGRMLFQRPKRG